MIQYALRNSARKSSVLVRLGPTGQTKQGLRSAWVHKTVQTCNSKKYQKFQLLFCSSENCQKLFREFVLVEPTPSQFCRMTNDRWVEVTVRIEITWTLENSQKTFHSLSLFVDKLGATFVPHTAIVANVVKPLVLASPEASYPAYLE